MALSLEMRSGVQSIPYDSERPLDAERWGVLHPFIFNKIGIYEDCRTLFGVMQISVTYLEDIPLLQRFFLSLKRSSSFDKTISQPIYFFKIRCLSEYRARPDQFEVPLGESVKRFGENSAGTWPFAKEDLKNKISRGEAAELADRRGSNHDEEMRDSLLHMVLRLDFK
jgi:hypothetical protein